MVLLLVSGNLRIPIAFRIYDKKKTKINLALDMFSYARNTLGIKKTEVYFDSWYSSKNILKRLKAFLTYILEQAKMMNKDIFHEMVKENFLEGGS